MKSRTVGSLMAMSWPSRPGGDLPLEGEDSRLVDKQVDRGVVAPQGAR